MPCNKPVFILSLDCEGKWGMADHLNAYHETHFTNRNIEQAYTKILSVLKEYNVPASFAFVSAFTQSPEEFKKNKDVFYNTPQSYKAWLAKFYHDMANTHYEGWFCPKPYQLVAEDGRHDIGSHSCFHRAFFETELTQEEAEYDFRASQELLAEREKPETFIYPRNVVGFTSLLEKYGFIGYRHAKAYTTNPVGRLLNLASEFNLLQKAEMPLPNAVLPAGFFLNWPHGLRKHVPNFITQLRWEKILKDAVAHNGVAHMWFHPHNFINHPTMHRNFKQIIKNVAHYRDQGLLSVMTMKDYIIDQRRL